MPTTKPGVPAGSPGLPRTVWILSAVSFFADVSGEMIYPLLPLFLVGVLGASKTHLGAIEGAAMCVVAILSAVAGFRSDRARRRVPWVRAGYALPVLGKAVISMATAWPMVLGGRLVDRLGKGLRSSARDALIVDAVEPDQRGRAFGLHRAFDTAGAFTGVLLAGAMLWALTDVPTEGELLRGSLTPAWVYRVIFGVGAALGLASALLTLLVREAPPTATAEPPTTTAGTAPHTALPRSYWTVLAALALFSLANSSDAFLLLRTSELGFAPWAVVLVYALYNLCYSVFSYPAGLLSDRIGRWGLIAAGWAIYAAVYTGFALLPASQAWGLWPLMAAYGLYMALTDGVGKALIADQAPPDRRGAAMGIFYATTGLTTLASSLLVGLVWDHASPQAAFGIGALVAVVALLALACARGASRGRPSRAFDRPVAP